MKTISVLMAAMLAAAIVLAAGLTVLPSAVQEAQANPCANEAEINIEVDGDIDVDGGDTADNDGVDNDLLVSSGDNDNRECNFNGYIDLD